jgi:FtsP/CotA-like multicopper oxidase with cupredoxin domain
VELENALNAPTTIHWHGMSVPYAMDGVTWQTEHVLAGERFVYTFPLTAAGTFWYHPHFDSAGQVDHGLYGALVVEDPSEPHVEELLLVFDRLLNASSDEYLDLGWPNMRQIASDQGLLSALVEPERVLLGPGDRAEAEWLLGTEDFAVVAHPYSKNGGAALGEPLVLFEVETSGDAAAPPAASWPFSGLASAPDPGASDIVYVFSGDPVTGDWRINGELFPDVTIESLALGSTAVIEVRNASATEHPFHLHGHAFEVLTAGGVAPSSRSIEDTVNVRIGEGVRLRLVADNPGDWMAHCHILSHADAGMMTVLRVQAP